ncbi:molybdenum cofactor biosynthesis protein MoaB [Desulfocucumis palustris]|uniref:Molybdenum cofactor biosynthesis protein MoaB n=1 Tax=Desulfocucumis palustris TaxID=1898651 RepID=A0A2L2XDV8_9FIRM|nr:MogA/MoaB family molybdenum cofactor biosynthesis protein [Desulfocucumis palustris]GBF34537.1 molybdenum cofactor biosynthesis protein MoaB [Desulfocucumis palustris]
MYRVAVVTASDKGARGERADKSAEVIGKMMAEINYEVVAYEIVPDDIEAITEALIDLADHRKAELILTTGGTGFSPRDNTPEATMAVIDRVVPGIPEAMRVESMKKTPKAMLSRAVAGIRRGTLIINMPGSPKAVRECLEVIIPVLPHALEILTGRGGECGSE